MKHKDFINNNLQNFTLTTKNIDTEIGKLLQTNLFSIYKHCYIDDEKRIYSLIIGKGEKKIILWAGMHGNEHTGIVSLFDFCNYILFNQDNLQKFTFVIIFNLNAYGIRMFTRVNYHNIDINRDAASLQLIESQFLMRIIKDINPFLCINLHDQRSIFNTNGSNPALLSFLSASENFEKNITYNRKFIMAIIVDVNNSLQKLIKGKIGRYSDDFYPTAFGDNLMKKGYKTILIESGIAYNDFYRTKTREYTFLSLVYILKSLINKTYLNVDYTDYFNIPENKTQMLDIIYRNCSIKSYNGNYVVDIGISVELTPNINQNSINKIYKIVNIGDLSNFYGHKEIDVKNKLVYNTDNSVIKINSEADFYIDNYHFAELLKEIH